MEDKALGSRYIDLSKLEADRLKSKEHRLMPEYIEKFFVEAYRSIGGSISPVSKGIWAVNRVPPELRQMSESLERRFGKVGTSYPKITFDKQQSVGYSELEFVGPAHPLFEGIVVERVLDTYGTSLRQGAASLTPRPPSRVCFGCSSAAWRMVGDKGLASGSWRSTGPQASTARASPMPCSTSKAPTPAPPCQPQPVNWQATRTPSSTGRWRR